MALHDARDDFDRFAATMLSGPDLLAVELSIRGAGKDLLTISTHLPSPVTLLLVCARNCDQGDLVGLRQRTAKCGEMLQEARWPFGMTEVEMLTRPAAELFAELQASEVTSVRRWERRVLAVGRVVTEHERVPTRTWLPRLSRWHEPARGVRGVQVRLGHKVRRAARIRRDG